MRITVRLWMLSAASAAEHEMLLELPESATVELVLSELGLLPQEPGLLLLVDGKAVDSRHSLQDGDVLTLLPRLAGG